MLLTVKGYKCFRNEVKIDINEVNILWGPMGAGKSSILESLSIFIDILNGNFNLRRSNGEVYTISETALDHLRGISINELINLYEKEMTIGLQDSVEGSSYLFSVTYNKESTLFQVKLKTADREVPISDLDISKVSEIIRELRQHILMGRSEDRYEEKEFIEKIIKIVEKEPNLKKYLETLLKINLIYISHHRPAPIEIKFSENTFTDQPKWSSMGKNIPDFLYNFIVRRVKKGQIMEKLEKYLQELKIIKERPSIEGHLHPRLEDFVIRIDNKDFRVLSCGERNSILLLLGSIITPPNGFLLIEEPEIGLHIRNFNELLGYVLEELRSKNAILILSTHSPIPLHTLRYQILNRRISSKEVNLFYVRKRDDEIQISKLVLDEAGRPIPMTTDVRDVLRSEVDSDILKNII